MAIAVIMPALDVTQESGKLLGWKKRAGERVSKGEAILEIETDKAIVEVEAPGDGILAGIRAEEGAVVPFGDTIAWLVQEGEAVPEAQASVKLAPEYREEIRPEGAEMRVALPASGAHGRMRASPKARRLAQELGVDLDGVHGSGPDGEIQAADVRAAADAVQPTGGTVEPLGAAARIAAERTAQGWRSIPHFFVSRDLDARPLLALRDRLAPEIVQAGGVKPSLNDLLVALVARVLRTHPRVNARWVNGSIHHNPDIDVAIAIAVGDAVVAGIVRQADRLDPGAIAARRRELAERAQAGRLQPADISGGTFTVSNLGMFGVDSFTAIIVPPQVAILAVGRVRDAVVALDGRPEVCPMMNVTLALDHRVGGGRTAALFLADLAEALARPEKSL